MRQRGNWGGEGAVVDGEGVLERVRGTLKNRQRQLANRYVASHGHSLVEVDLFVDAVLFQVGEQEGGPTPSRPQVVVGSAGGIRVAVDIAGRKNLVGIVIGVQCQPDLLEVISALGEARCLAHLLHSRNQKSDQDR